MKLFSEWLPANSPNGVCASPVLRVLAIALGMTALVVQATDGPPIIVLEPQSQSALSGATVSFETDATGAPFLSYQWQHNGTNLTARTNAILTLTNVQPRHWGNYALIVTNSHGAVTSSVATLIIDADLVFRILGLQTNSFVAVEHNRITGDDRGGIAVSADNVFVTGDGQGGGVTTGRFPIDNLGAGTALSQAFDALTGNLRTDTVYSLGNGANPIQYANSSLSANSVNSLLEIDGITGQLTGGRINFSTNIPISTSTGVFAGYDRVIIYSGANSRAYDIRLPSGTVTDLGSIGFISRQSSESWAFWGVAEYFAGSLYIVHAQNLFLDGVSGTAIVRTRLPDRSTTPILGPIPFQGWPTWLRSPSRFHAVAGSFTMKAPPFSGHRAAPMKPSVPPKPHLPLKSDIQPSYWSRWIKSPIPAAT